MANELLILGAGGFGREASLLVEEINVVDETQLWQLLGFIDDDRAKWGLNYRGYPVRGGSDLLQEIDCGKVQLICVISDPRLKFKVVENSKKMGFNYATLIHPDLCLASDVTVGDGVLINKGCLLTVNIKIGDHVSINPGCGIGHDSIIGEYSTLMWRVNISGNVNLGAGCLVGSGATVLQGLTIGAGVTIGAGAVVTKDLPEGCTAVGVPARVV